MKRQTKIKLKNLMLFYVRVADEKKVSCDTANNFALFSPFFHFFSFFLSFSPQIFEF